VGLAALGIEPVGMGRNVAEQVERVGREPGVMRRVFEGAVSPTPRLVEPAEYQTSTTQPVVGSRDLAKIPLPRLTLAELTGFPEPDQRLACFADVREDHGGGGEGLGKLKDDVPRPERRDCVLDQ
jgi:hypothetical protein